VKLVRYGELGAERPGLIDGAGDLRDLSGEIDDIGPAMLGAETLGRLAAIDPSGLPVVEPGGRIGAPITRPGNFHAIGLNYHDHAREAGMEVPDEPVLFNKATSAISGPGDDIRIPPGATKVDWEVELGIVIGRETYRVPVHRALDCVAGFAIVNDVSERDFQLAGTGQWTKGKSAPTFGPVGPWLVTTDEVGDPQALDLWLDVNGVRMQSGNTATMIFSVAEIVAYMSRHMVLLAGDLIATGTPPGVGLGRTPPRYLRPGDDMRLGIEGLGEQRLRVVAETERG